LNLFCNWFADVSLALVSRHPIYDLMRDYLTLSWARFSKDVQSHTLQISKILAHPAPRAGDLIRLDATPKNEDNEASLEVIARFPGGLDFGRGLVDVNFTMWPLFKCLNVDKILTLCEVLVVIALQCIRAVNLNAPKTDCSSAHRPSIVLLSSSCHVGCKYRTSQVDWR
jgi:hypothetical protein